MRWVAAVGLIGAGLALAGCGSGTVPGTADPEAVASGEPAFSPCDDVPPDALHAVGVDPSTSERDIDGVKQPGWNRCRWAGTDHSLTVFATTRTWDEIRGNDRNTDLIDQQINGRDVMVYRESTDVRGERCDVAFRAGDGASIVRVSLYNPERSGDPCELAVHTATALEGAIPK
ncbi:DUF3558 domain-containing protein [Rhodococcus sp. BE178]|uniref:DUF3558 domain-containing protein n=1 Tax=Rhodococcus sp. BE178 TaxID=2817737 RepID=UPI003D2305E8